MSHSIFRTSQDFTALRFGVAARCFVTAHVQGPRHQPRAGTLLPFLALLLGIAVSADAGQAL